MIETVIAYFAAFSVPAFAELALPGWVQGLLFVVFVAGLAFGLTDAIKGGVMLKWRSASSLAKEDPKSWQWAWRGVAGAIGAGVGAVLGAGSVLLILAGLALGLLSSWLYKLGHGWLNEKFAGILPGAKEA